MNLVFYPLQQPACLRPDYVFFYDKKKNMIIDGVFSKLRFSNEHISCAGITLNTPFEYQNPRLLQYNTKPNTPQQKSRFNMDVVGNENGLNVKWNFQLKSSELNHSLITMLTQYEHDILTQYKLMSGLKHTPVFSLETQLMYDHVVVHSANNELPEHVSIVLKISGVWETSTHIGITYKMIVE